MTTQQQVLSHGQDARSAAIAAACDVAAGATVIPDDAAPIRIRAAYKDVSARGSIREWWYRMVWRGAGWEYVSAEYLPTASYYSSDRHVTLVAEVWPGELVVQHDRGGGIDAAYLVVMERPHLVSCKFSRTRDGQLRIVLPDGRDVIRPDPRRR